MTCKILFDNKWFVILNPVMDYTFLALLDLDADVFQINPKKNFAGLKHYFVQPLKVDLNQSYSRRVS